MAAGDGATAAGPTAARADIPRVISKEALAALPIRRYDGPVHVVETAEQAAAARADFQRERVIGFDTETRPTFRKGQVHLPCLLQAATARAVYLFSLQHAATHTPAAELLAELRRRQRQLLCPCRRTGRPNAVGRPHQAAVPHRRQLSGRGRALAGLLEVEIAARGITSAAPAAR